MSSNSTGVTAHILTADWVQMQSAVRMWAVTPVLSEDTRVSSPLMCFSKSDVSYYN